MLTADARERAPGPSGRHGRHAGNAANVDNRADEPVE